MTPVSVLGDAAAMGSGSGGAVATEPPGTESDTDEAEAHRCETFDIATRERQRWCLCATGRRRPHREVEIRAGFSDGNHSGDVNHRSARPIYGNKRGCRREHTER